MRCALGILTYIIVVLYIPRHISLGYRMWAIRLLAGNDATALAAGLAANDDDD